ncbi:MAG: ABC transporter permease subunit [Lachnospiraceae bacterium]|nr:ABC transporter permease subunit [Lachnospiraceae bacterium]MBR1453742.1 ABC transporter permease subunit [Lachnospiraceae bacterium]
MNKVRNNVIKYSITVFIFLLLIFIYYYTTENNIANPYFFPKISKIMKAFNDSKDQMLENLIASFKLVIPSIFVSLIVGIGIGTIMGLNEWVRDSLHPIIYAFSVIPSILLSPFVLFLSPNITIASIILIVYNTLWATLFATITGIMTIDKRYLDKSKTLQLNGFKKFFRVILPAASPSIVAGFINSLRSTFVMLVFAEMYGAQSGMGYFVRINSEYGLYDKVWCGFIFLVIVLVIVMQLFELLKKYILRWTM